MLPDPPCFPAGSSQVRYLCLGEFSGSMLRRPRFAAGIVGLFARCPSSLFPGSGLGCGRAALCSLTGVRRGLLSAFQGVRGCVFSPACSPCNANSTLEHRQPRPSEQKESASIDQKMLLGRAGRPTTPSVPGSLRNTRISLDMAFGYRGWGEEEACSCPFHTDRTSCSSFSFAQNKLRTEKFCPLPPLCCGRDGLRIFPSQASCPGL